MSQNACLAVFVTFCLFSLGTAGPGAASSPHMSALDTAATEFSPFVLTNIAHSLDAVRTMRDRVAAHDLPGAQRAWLAARGGWESSEIVTSEYFPELDRAIDAWPDGNRGFHAIEARLFGAHTTEVLEPTVELVNNLTELERQLRTTTLTAQRLLNGAARLTYEIGEDKAAGGESPFSGNSLAEMVSNVSAIAALYERVLAPAAKQKHLNLAGQVAAELTHLRALVEVPTLSAVDQPAVRAVSESLTADLADLGEHLGLARPALGN